MHIVFWTAAKFLILVSCLKKRNLCRSEGQKQSGRWGVREIGTVWGKEVFPYRHEDTEMQKGGGNEEEIPLLSSQQGCENWDRLKEPAGEVTSGPRAQKHGLEMRGGVGEGKERKRLEKMDHTKLWKVLVYFHTSNLSEIAGQKTSWKTLEKWSSRNNLQGFGEAGDTQGSWEHKQFTDQAGNR